ncbi:MAG: MmcQ/YjbR family DNA-binding protein [Armatimonadaceae bacterium]
MTLETLCETLRAKTGATESYPFGPGALVFKVGGKMFAIVADDKDPVQVSLKCDPERALDLRAVFPAVQPGYHLNKTHWNTVTLDDTIFDDELSEWIDHSYDLVYRSLSRTLRESIKTATESD